LSIEARNQRRAFRGFCAGRGLPADWHVQEERTMKKFVLLAAAGICLAPALISSASAQSVTVRVGEPGYRGSVTTKKVVTSSHCRYVTTRTKRSNGTVWVRKVRKCG
jgi:hypothetical protein